MTFKKGDPRPPGAGRKPGIPNKATADIKALAAAYGPEAVETVALIMRTGEQDKTRLAAAMALLDRGFGRPAQSVDLSNSDGTLQAAATDAIEGELKRLMGQTRGPTG